MTRLAIICITWMVISAVTAYYADIWGKRLGKKRKTIWGLRPKHTAIVIITCSGALIALLSFVILLTADAGIRRALLNWDQIVAQMRATQTELRGVRGDLANTKAQVAATQDQLNKATALIASAAARVKDAQTRLAGARKDLALTQSELTAKQKQLGVVQASLQRTLSDLQQTSAKLRQTNVALAARKQLLKNAQRVLFNQWQVLRESDLAVERSLHGEVAARAGDELGRVVVARGQSIHQVRETLRRLLNDAGRLVQQRAKTSKYEGNPFVAVRTKVVFQRVGGKVTQVRISGEKSTELAAKRLSGSSVPPGGTVVRLIAKANAMGGDTVPVDFELFENHVVFDKGQEIVSFVIRVADVKQSAIKPTVMNALTGALKDIRAKALDSGLIPAADGSVGSLPPYQLPDVYSEVIRALRGGQEAVRVRVMADQETWTSDELKVRFEVRRFTEGG